MTAVVSSCAHYYPYSVCIEDRPERHNSRIFHSSKYTLDFDLIFSRQQMEMISGGTAGLMVWPKEIQGKMRHTVEFITEWSF